MLGAASSAFRHLGYVTLASAIDTAGQNRDRTLHALASVREIVQRADKRKRIEIIKAVSRKRRFDPLQEAQNYAVCVIGLRSADGKGDHAVALAGGMIFDANMTRAMPMTQENLDYCCSTDLSQSKFVADTRGWLFRHRNESS